MTKIINDQMRPFLFVAILNTVTAFEHRVSLDGVRGFVVNLDGEKTICGISFKFAFNSNFTLRHLIVKVCFQL